MTPYDAIDREPIWVALFQLLQKSCGPLFVTMGRFHRRPPQLLPEQQPALFLLQLREKHEPRPSGLPNKITLEGMIVLYVQASSPLESDIGAETALGATTLNMLFKAIDTALRPDNPSGKLTLGGRVQHCWREGNTDMDPGIVSAQGAAIVPVKLLIP